MSFTYIHAKLKTEIYRSAWKRHADTCIKCLQLIAAPDGNDGVENRRIDAVPTGLVEYTTEHRSHR